MLNPLPVARRASSPALASSRRVHARTPARALVGAMTLAVVTGLSAPPAHAQWIEEVPLPSTNYADVFIHGLSADGGRVCAVLKERTNNFSHAAVLNPDGSWTILNKLPGAIGSETVAISGDGQTILGYCTFSSGPSVRVRWNAAGVVALAPQPPGVEAFETALNHDGTVIAGRVNNTAILCQPFTGYTYKWTPSGGFDVLPNPVLDGAGIAGLSPVDISDDGLVVLQDGTACSGTAASTFPCYTRDTITAGGVVQSTFVLEAPVQAQPVAISGDGLTVVGQLWTGSRWRAVLWDTVPPMKFLGPAVAHDCTGYCSSWPFCVSADGRAVTGLVFDTSSVWVRGADGTPIPPPTPLADELAARGADLAAAGLGLSADRAWMSADARVFVTRAFRGNTALLVRIRLRCPVTTPWCAGDFNCSRDVSPQDLFDFLARWFAHDPMADVNHANGISVQDIFDFLAAWFAGCN